MNKASGLIILLNEDQPSVKNLNQTLQSLGRDTAAAANYEAIADLCSDPLIQPVVVCSENTPIETPSQRQQLQAFAASPLGIIAMSQACTLSEESIDQSPSISAWVWPMWCSPVPLKKITNTPADRPARGIPPAKRLYRTELEKATWNCRRACGC